MYFSFSILPSSPLFIRNLRQRSLDSPILARKLRSRLKHLDYGRAPTSVTCGLASLKMGRTTKVDNLGVLPNIVLIP